MKRSLSGEKFAYRGKNAPPNTLACPPRLPLLSLGFVNPARLYFFKADFTLVIILPKEHAGNVLSMMMESKSTKETPARTENAIAFAASVDQVSNKLRELPVKGSSLYSLSMLMFFLVNSFSSFHKDASSIN